MAGKNTGLKYWIGAGALSLAWLGLVGFGAARGDIMEAPLAVQLGAAALALGPAAFIWIVALFMERAAAARFERESMWPLLAALTSKDGVGASIVSENLERIKREVGAATGFLESKSVQVLANIADRTAEFATRADAAAVRVADVAAGLVRSIESAGEAAKGAQGFVAAALDRLDKQSAFISERLDAQTRAFEASSGAVLSTVSGIELRFTNIISSVSELGANVRKDFEGILGEKDAFVKAVGELKESAASTSAAISDAADRITSTSAIVKKAIDEVGAAMLDSTNNLGSQAELAVKRAADIRTTLKVQTDELEAVANNVRTHTRIGELSIAEEGKKLAGAMEGLLEKIGSMNDRISATSANLLALGAKIGDRLQEVNAVIVAKTTSATDRMTQTLERASEGAGEFKETSDRFAVEAAAASDRVKALLYELRQQAVSLETSVKVVRENVGSMQSDMAKILSGLPSLDRAVAVDAANVEEATGRVMARLTEVAEGFSAFAHAKSSELAVLSSKSREEITRVAQYANKMSLDAQNSIETFALEYKEMTDGAAAADEKIRALLKTLAEHKDLLQGLFGTGGGPGAGEK